MQDRHGIFIDVENTRSIFVKNEIFYYQAIDTLLSTSIKISYNYQPDRNNRFFLHQMGADGIFIISESLYNTPEIPISIALVIMQTLLLQGVICKAGISKGTNADIKSCLPKTQELISVDPPNHWCGGLMSRLNVMGTALIESYKCASIKPRGSRLVIGSSAVSEIPKGVIVSENIDSETLILDWVHSETTMLNYIYKSISIEQPLMDELEKLLRKYVRESGDWAYEDGGINTLKLNRCKQDGN